MPPLDDDIRAYYDRGEEQARLEVIDRLEELRTRELLRRLLPSPPATVLDVGGGPGAYAIWLAELGYEVHLVDPVPLHVEQAGAASAASARPLASAALGDARALAFRHLPDELRGELLHAGFGDVEVLAIEGIGECVADVDGWLDDPDRRELLLRTLRRLEREPSLLGASPHLMAVGRA